jgi:hypothetical protein
LPKHASLNGVAFLTGPSEMVQNAWGP